MKLLLVEVVLCNERHLKLYTMVHKQPRDSSVS